MHIEGEGTHRGSELWEEWCHGATSWPDTRHWKELATLMFLSRWWWHPSEILHYWACGVAYLAPTFVKYNSVYASSSEIFLQEFNISSRKVSVICRFISSYWLINLKPHLLTWSLWVWKWYTASVCYCFILFLNSGREMLFIEAPGDYNNRGKLQMMRYVWRL